jgi:hypothetical protein
LFLRDDCEESIGNHPASAEGELRAIRRGRFRHISRYGIIGHWTQAAEGAQNHFDPGVVNSFTPNSFPLVRVSCLLFAFSRLLFLLCGNHKPRKCERKSEDEAQAAKVHER